jgi:lysophospholipase L1-like esterase
MTITRRLQAACAFILLACAAVVAQSREPVHWVGAWATAVVALPPAPAQAPNAPGQAPGAASAAQASPGAAAGNNQTAAADPGRGRAAGPGGGRGGAGRGRIAVNDQTLRQIVRTSIGGDRLRVVVTNAFGTSPLAIAAGHVAMRAKDAAIADGGKPLLFSGRATATIPAGAVLVSDPVDLRIPAFTEIAIDLHVPGNLSDSPSPLTMHAAGLQTSYLSATGNHAGRMDLPGAATTQSVYLLARVEVAATPQTVAIVAFGDSITDGTRSTPDTNRRWPDRLAARLAQHAPGRYAVLNMGIAGNRVLTDGAGVNALARFDRDVLVQPGAGYVVIMEGINDIGQARENPTPAAADVIAGHQQLIARARARGLRVFGATLTPFDGAAYFTAVGEEKRKAVNEWIRTSQAYDAVIDFDALLRDPSQPSKFLPAYDSGDHLHPSDAGYEAMGNAVDLTLFAAR